MTFVVQLWSDVSTVAPETEDDKSEQWMGVSVVSQATDDGKALVSMSNSYLYYYRFDHILVCIMQM